MDGAQAGLVGRCAVVHDGDPLRLRPGPGLKVVGKLVVRDDYVFVHQASAVDIIDEPVEDGLVAHREQGLGEVLGQRVEPRGIACGKDETFHWI